MQCLSQDIALMLFKEQRHFFSSFKASSWTARWDRQGLHISDCRKAEQPWIESVSICWQLSKFVLYVIQQSRDWKLEGELWICQYVPWKQVCELQYLHNVGGKKRFMEFYFLFLVSFGFLYSWLSFTFKSVDSSDTTRIFLDGFMLLKNQLKMFSSNCKPACKTIKLPRRLNFRC